MGQVTSETCMTEVRVSPQALTGGDNLPARRAQLHPGLEPWNAAQRPR